MRTDERLAPSLDPPGGFLISGTRPQTIPSRLDGLEEFLAAPPMPDEPRPAWDDLDELALGAVPPFTAVVDETPQEVRPQISMNGGRSPVETIAGESPRIEAGFSEPSPPPRTLAAEAAALAAADPRALVALADILVESPNSADVDDQTAAIFGDMLESGALVDPAEWFAAESPSSASAVVIDGAPRFGSRGSEPSPSPIKLDGGQATSGSDRLVEFLPSDDRVDESPAETLREIEARLSRVVARLEDVANRVESTSPAPLSSRPRGFRGRIDE